MRKIILVSIVVSQILLATNGDLMIGTGTKSTSMGGVGIAVNHGAEIVNPAMLKDIKNSEIAGSITYFMPDVRFQNTMNPAFVAATSGADSSFIPTISYATNNNENFCYGLGIIGAAGMGVDYASKNNGAFDMKTALQIAKVSTPIAYKINEDFTVALEPIMQYATLQMNYTSMAGASNNPKSYSVNFGYNLGLAYDYNDFTFGAVYKSAIKANYKNNISSAIRDFGLTGAILSGDTLEQPAEIGIGVAYKSGSSTFGIDYKQIRWADTKGYSDFGWNNQNVIACGYKYDHDELAWKLGYNHASNPIKEQAAATSYTGAAKNFFNIAGFPAIIENHYTFGMDYSYSDKVTITSAFVYSPKVKESYDITALSMAFSGGNATADTTHSQKALTLGASYKF